MEAPQNPAGPYEPDTAYVAARRDAYITEIAAAPVRLRRAVAGLSAAQLETKYRNWTIRQITHHIADSHLNGYVRFKLALTEDRPTIKPYSEGAWSELPDAQALGIEATLPLLDGLHARWVSLLQAMTPEQYARTYFHPEWNAVVPLFEALGYYAWHGRHHTGQIAWLRRERLGLPE
jgi:uncharacterized damage-inducible protein DinB